MEVVHLLLKWTSMIEKYKKDRKMEPVDNNYKNSDDRHTKDQWMNNSLK